MRIPVIGRLLKYKQILGRLPDGHPPIFSHHLARLAGVSPSLLRRDLMLVAVSGRPNRGYEITDLHQAIASYVHANAPVVTAIVGAGSLGTALAHFLGKRHPARRPSVIFDRRLDLLGTRIGNLIITDVRDFESTISLLDISLVVLALPPDEAPAIAQRAYAAGIRAFLDFSTASLQLPSDAHIEEIDIGVFLDRAAFCSHLPASAEPVCSTSITG